ncbi:MAG: hypothetical protein ABI818_07355 [Acidobacteriota bacterium]
MLYTKVVRRLLFLLVLGFLVIDATGLEALVRPEPCTSLQDTQPDGTCPPTCTTCACGVQVIVPDLTVPVTSTLVRQTLIDRYSRGLPRVVPSKIFHVPKLTSLAL